MAAFCALCEKDPEDCRCHGDPLKPIDTSKLEFRNPPGAPPVPPGWELTGVAADSRARVTLLIDRDDCVRGVYASQGQAESERDKRNDDPGCKDSPYSTKTWNIDDTADSQVAGVELPARALGAWWEQSEPPAPLSTTDALTLWYELKRSQGRECHLRSALEAICDYLAHVRATPLEWEQTVSGPRIEAIVDAAQAGKPIP